MKKGNACFLAMATLLAGIAVTGCDPRSGPQPASKTTSGAQAEAAKAIGDADFDQTIASGVALVDFWAPWCGPCRMQGPIVEKVAEAVGAKVLVAKVNVDDNRATAQKFDVRSIPTLIVFKDGKPVQRFVGVQTMNTLVAAIEVAGK